MSILTLYMNESLCCWLLCDRVAHPHSLYRFSNDKYLVNPVKGQLHHLGSFEVCVSLAQSIHSIQLFYNWQQTRHTNLVENIFAWHNQIFCSHVSNYMRFNETLSVKIKSFLCYKILLVNPPLRCGRVFIAMPYVSQSVRPSVSPTSFRL